MSRWERQRERHNADSLRLCGLTTREIDELATYNGEVARGILHSEEWKRRMAELQRTYKEHIYQEAR